MARLTYSAPGVYVEEVPSAQQPIAGVGTNTVGFIGIWSEKVIHFPIPNAAYDPQVAEKAAQPAPSKSAIAAAEAALTAAKTKLGELQKELKGSDGEEKKKTDEITKAKADVEANEKRVAALKQPVKPEDDKIKPYLLTTKDAEDENKRSLVLDDKLIGDAKLCTNFTEYTSRFGDFSAYKDGDDKDIPLIPGHRDLTHAVSGFFKNGGTRCWVVWITDPGMIRNRALKEFESIDEIAIIAAPGQDAKGDVGLALVEHCENMEDRFAILDCPHIVGTDTSAELNLLTYGDPATVLPQRNRNAAYYFPYLEVIDPAKQLQDKDPARGVELKDRGKVYVAPSGHVAGVYARVDEQRGVHKAPGNEAILGTRDVKYYIGKAKQELLNPQGVNCIRTINGNIRIWGARTLGGDSNGEWKYINVRRLFLFLKESIDEGTQWVVFEPNDMALWGKIRRNISNFLTNVWRSGALFGATPQEAFYVKCDEETNPASVRDEGKVVTEIGVAIVRPAEFVIFRITQWSAQKES